MPISVMPAMFGLAAALLAVGILSRRQPSGSPVGERLEKLGMVVETNSEEESFHERVVAPAARWLSASLQRKLPSRLPRKVAQLIREAGWTIGSFRFIALWFATAFGLASILALFGILGGSPVVGLGLASVGGGLGLYIPWLLLRRGAKRRATEIDRELPDAIDLIVTCVESGLGLQAAMIRVAEHLDGAIALEFRQAAREVAMGRPRDETLTAMAERSGSRELRLLARAIIQAEQMGVSVGQVLRNQSRELRERRRQRAREKANMVPVKITIPTVLFIFPTLFLLMLGPVALNMFEFFGAQ